MNNYIKHGLNGSRIIDTTIENFFEITPWRGLNSNKKKISLDLDLVKFANFLSLR